MKRWGTTGAFPTCAMVAARPAGLRSSSITWKEHCAIIVKDTKLVKNISLINITSFIQSITLINNSKSIKMVPRRR